MWEIASIGSCGRHVLAARIVAAARHVRLQLRPGLRLWLRLRHGARRWCAGCGSVTGGGSTDRACLDSRLGGCRQVSDRSLPLGLLSTFERTALTPRQGHARFGIRGGGSTHVASSVCHLISAVSLTVHTPMGGSVAERPMLSRSASMRSSTVQKGSFRVTGEQTPSSSRTPTQSTLTSRRRSSARATTAPRRRARVVAGGVSTARRQVASSTNRRRSPAPSRRCRSPPPGETS